MRGNTKIDRVRDTRLKNILPAVSMGGTNDAHLAGVRTFAASRNGRVVARAWTCTGRGAVAAADPARGDLAGYDPGREIQEGWAVADRHVVSGRRQHLDRPDGRGNQIRGSA